MIEAAGDESRPHVTDRGPGRVALVTGGNRGIGLAVCRALADAGLLVLLGARDRRLGEAAAASLGERVRAVELDVADGRGARSAVARAAEEHGRLDVLVNNAGIYEDEGVPALDVDPEVVRRTFATNLFGPLVLAQVAAPLMRRQRYGRIVNLSSGYGRMDAQRAGLAAYKLSKLSLNGLTRILADELHGDGVLVNAMDPGWVRTRMGGAGASRTPEAAADTALWLATLPDDGPTGGFFRDRRAIPW